MSAKFTRIKLLLRKAIYILAILQTTVLISCKKFLDIAPPKTQIVSALVFSNDATATSAVRGIYSQMTSDNGFGSGNPGSITFLAGYSSDELNNYTTDADYMSFYANAILPNNSLLFSGLWQEPYNYIINANSAIEGLSNSTGVTSATKNQLTGEAKFIRAFCNFYLVNLFGDVPLITSTDYRVNSSASRTPKSQVYQQIIQDLKDAESLLSNDYSFSNEERVEPNRWAASALLARVYLFSGDWQNAEQSSTDVINNSMYSLCPDLNNVFLKNSSEAIWQLKPTSVVNNTNEGFSFILTSSPSFATLSNQLLNSFETGDNRKISWVQNFAIGMDTFYYPYKYKIKTGNPPLNEYSMVLRLAEQYLIRAEAKVEQNDISGGQSDLNIIRNRAGLPNTTADIQPSLLSAILHERQTELFTEWGHRWLDLKRTGTIDMVMSSVTQQKGNTWNTNQSLYPIPQSEVINDKNLTQNPGY